MSTTTFPLATVAAQVTAQGISAPTFNEILSSYQASVRSIFGTDIYIDPDSKDGQLLAILAQAQYDSNQCAIAVYNSYNPQTATGVALDSAVKVNGIKRQSATFSVAILTLVGVTGTQIFRGIAQDNLNRLWDMPDTVIIPGSGTIDVEATCQQVGAIQAQIHTITIPFTQVVGWQSVTNNAAAIPGAPVESDGQLRRRQSYSTSLTARTTPEALLANVANLTGVTRVAIYVNDTDATDSNGIPSHSFTMVVQGGDEVEIAQKIEQVKDVGAGTHGTTSIVVKDPAGLDIPIQFSKLVSVPLVVEVRIHPLAGFGGTTLGVIAASLVNFVNTLGIGADVYLAWMTAAASLGSNPTFTVTQLTQARDGNALAAADIPIGYNEAPTLTAANITILEV